MSMASNPALPTSAAEAVELMDEWWPRWTAFLDEEENRGRADAAGSDGWTLAEAVAHVARWHQWSVARASTLAAGGRLQEIDVDGLNAAWAEQDRGIAFAEARARGDQAHRAFRERIASIPPESWSRALGRLVVANSSEHYQEHMGWHDPAEQTEDRTGRRPE
jgi:hypothetical protein